MALFSPKALPSDYFIKTHQFTKTVHRDVYPAIDPTSPNLSQKGKSVIVTGASQGIGKAIALAFAKAGASKIALASRSAAKLTLTKEEILTINPDAEVLVLPTDTTSEESVTELERLVEEKIGVPDILVNSAGSWQSSDTIAESKVDEWWGDFEVNLKGTYLLTRSFLRLVKPDRPATIINVGSWGMLTTGPVGSSYAISKLALVRLTECVAAAYPHVRSVVFHPGMTRTEMAESHPEVLAFCGDSVELSAGAAVWLASEKAGFLSGRYMSANWDVGELEEREEEIEREGLLKFDLKGEFGVKL